MDGMPSMKRLLSYTFAALLLLTSVAQAQFAVVQGEASPGVYVNVPADPTTHALQFECLIGCVAGSGVLQASVVASAPTFPAGSPANIPMSTHGELFVICNSGCSSSSGTGASNTDGVASAATGLGQSVTFNYGYNGTTWDRFRVDGSKNLLVGINAALPTGGNVIGAVTQSGAPWSVSQSGAPWSQNVTQFGGTNISTGTGAGGLGIPRVTVSSDSSVLAVQSGTYVVQPGNTANTTPWLMTLSQGGNVGVITAAGASKVDGSAVTQPVSGTVAATQSGAWAVSVTGTVTTSDLADGSVGAGAAGSKSILGGLVFNSALPSLSSGQQAALQGDASGRLITNVAVLPSLPAGAASIGNVGLNAGANNIGSVVPAAGTGVGASSSKLLTAASTNSTNVKGSAATLYAMAAFNDDTVPYYVKTYNKATAPTCGTDTPVHTYEIPASSSGYTLSLGAAGAAYSLGLGLCVTKAITDADTTATIANKAVVDVVYQ